MALLTLPDLFTCLLKNKGSYDGPETEVSLTLFFHYIIIHFFFSINFVLF